MAGGDGDGWRLCLYNVHGVADEARLWCKGVVLPLRAGTPVGLAGRWAQAGRARVSRGGGVRTGTPWRVEEGWAPMASLGAREKTSLSLLTYACTGKQEYRRAHALAALAFKGFTFTTGDGDSGP